MDISPVSSLIQIMQQLDKPFQSPEAFKQINEHIQSLDPMKGKIIDVEA